MSCTRVLVDCQQLEKSRVGTHHFNTHNLHCKVLYTPRQSVGKRDQDIGKRDLDLGKRDLVTT